MQRRKGKHGFAAVGFSQICSSTGWKVGKEGRCKVGISLSLSGSGRARPSRRTGMKRGGVRLYVEEAPKV
ncbi:hypothetical protein KFK09_028261 [Dendrobium nobile]|uniref:Uncharacterized protein n=1 Tax=Dendrobium nobile TaxID=94219 RepID=A0A8T3A327_DENNO|nr:hypothetical protein KFK09_028261 [Dendrobium nobile]